MRSAWHKWDWAAHHGDLLEAEIDRVVKADGNADSLLGIGHERDPKLESVVVTVQSLGPFPPNISLMTGDLVQNYRSALDHAAWFLVHQGATGGRLKESALQRISFPIYDCREDFNNSLATKLPGVVDPHVLEVITKVQPYNATQADKPLHALRLIRDLSNYDKHRALHPVGLRLQSVGCKVVRKHDLAVIDINPITPPGILEVGDKLARIFARVTGPKPHLEVGIDVAGDVALSETLWIKNLIRETKVHVFRILAEFGQPPRELDPRLDGA
jgi:hypothetical protein